MTDTDVIARADAFIPLLSAEADGSDRQDRLTAVAVDALRRGRMFSLLNPGPNEATLRTVVEVCARLAHGHGSSAWLVALAAGASYQTSLFDEAARADVWGDDPETNVCGSIAMAGTARRVDGGLEVSGRWQPVSGVHDSSWVTLGVVDSDNGERFVVLLPVPATTVELTWQVAGMRGTGSDTVHADRVFVPEHRALTFGELLARAERRMPFVSAGVVSLLGPVLGLAEAALEQALIRLGKGRPVGMSIYRNAVDAPSVQIAVARASSLIDTARLHTFRAVGDLEQGSVSTMTRARIRMDAATVVTSTRRAVSLLLDVCGSGAFADNQPLQRIWRDLEVVTRHQMLFPGLSEEIYGRALLGTGTQVSPLI